MASRRFWTPAFLLAFALSLSAAPAAPAAWFARGDVDASGDLSITDSVVLLGYLFLGEAKPGCLDAADLDDNGALEITDAVLILDHLFLGGPPPEALLRGCWNDPTPDALDCERFEPCSSLGVFYTVDRSGSMREAELWRSIQNQVVQGISGLNDGDEFGICFFDAALRRFPDVDVPTRASAETKAAAIDYVTSFYPGAGTCPQPALVQALDYAKQSAARNRMIIHVADGHNTCGKDSVLHAEEILNTVRSLNTDHVPIQAIAIGFPDSINGPWMRRLAEENGGQYAEAFPP